MTEAGVSFLLSNSFSKNLSLYGERCGGLSIICQNAEEASRVLGQMKFTVRRNYSSPPTHGGQVTAAVMNTPETARHLGRRSGRNARAHQGHAPEAV